MAKLIVPGRRNSALEGQPVGSGRFLHATVNHSVTLEATRAEGDEIVIPDVAEDDVLELTLDGGVTWWTTVDELRALENGKARGEGKTDEIRVPLSIRTGEPSRGFGKWLLKGLNLIGVDLPGGTARVIARQMEQQLEPGPGLYRCPDPTKLEEAARPADFEGSKPSLLFIHGTASSTEGSFGGLTLQGNAAAWQALQTDYENRIFAFEHETLSKSPLENVLDLLHQLPPKATLHLVSHSRGGIVGEILTRGMLTRRLPFDEIDEAVFRRAATGDNGRQADIDTLRDINTLFKEKQITVERFVRVACPAAGTTLASGRLDRYLNVIVNLIGRIPILQASQVYDFTTSFLLATVKKRTDPAALPGLEAQMPGAPLIRILNNPAVEVPSELLVISGDVERSGFWQSLKVIATDLFYRADHDFVVNTASMYGGAQRTSPAYFFFDKGSDVDHFHYFINQKTQKALVAGLKGQPGTESGYRPIELRQKEVSVKLAAERGGGPRPVLFVLPGIMGSQLAVGDDRIWINLLDIARGKMRQLNIDAPNVSPKALVGKAYADIVDFLSDSHVVVPFPYDWRRSIYEAADLLAEAVKKQLDATDQPIRLLAHSMGGLVARTMIAKHDTVWEQMTERDGCRFIMLGTPNGGSYNIPRVLLGREKTFRMLHIIDLVNSSTDLLDIISRYTGLLQLLPMGKAPDFFSEATWKAIKDAVGDGRDRVSAADLQDAATIRDALQHPLDPKYVLYVAGKAPATPCRHEIVDDEKGTDAVRFIATPRGDGKVTWAKGIPVELREKNTWYMEAEHGKLADHREAFPALLELLQKGKTDLLSKSPLSISRGIQDEFPMPEDEPTHYPDELTLVGAALGFEPSYAASPSMQRVKVSITQGDLGNARHPVAVGHHKNDGIVSAERALDVYMDNRLTERHRLGLYPGEIETAEVILEGTTHPPGAVVLGLGNFGELTAGTLARSVTYAALTLAMKKREQAMDAQQAKPDSAADPRPLGISPLLIGTGFGGLTMRTSLRAILTGIQQANQRLRASALEGVQTIDAVEFIEIFEDRAVQAARVLRELISQEMNDAFTLAEQQVRRVDGGRRRQVQDWQADWWHRLKVVEHANQSYLTFTSLTDRARAPVDNLPTQRALMDTLIEQAVQTPEWNQNLAQAMFELLIPNTFKEYASDRRNILWIVDQAAAAYPWELLHDPSRGDQLPIAVQAGVLRQLAVTEYRLQVESPAESRALIVGDPLNNNDAFPELEGAQQEAALVTDLLGVEDFQLECHIKKSATEIITALFKHNYQIIHLAGHGVFNYLTPEQIKAQNDCDRLEGSTGMVLDKGAFLTPGVIKQMRQVPDLVFVNCCHLGRVDAGEELRANRHKLAANLGTQLIQMGVRAVVAAGWAVNDAAAETFARTFYTHMLQGMTFGEAVRQARLKTYTYHPQSNTWGAYQCYGDPYYRLKLPRKHTGGKKEETTYVDPLEVEIDLENIASRAKAASSRQLQWLKIDLQHIADAVPQTWLDRGAIVEAFAVAYALLDMYPEAVTHYERLRTLDEATYSMRALEQLANMKARWGANMATTKDAPPADRHRGEQYVEDAIKQLKYLLAMATTTERLNLLGSAYKRSSMLTQGPVARPEALTQSASYYRQAFELTLERQASGGHELLHYPLINWLTLEAIRIWYGTTHWKTVMTEAVRIWYRDVDEEGESETVPDLEEQFRQALTAAEEEALAADRQRPSFWELAAPATINLLYLLRDGVTREKIYREEILAHFTRAWRRGGSFKHRNSIEEHFAFLIEMMQPKYWSQIDDDTQQEMKKLGRELQDIWDDLAEIMKE